MRVGVAVRRSVNREGNVEAQFVGLACRDLDAIAGGDASNHDLCDAKRLQVRLKVGFVKAPGVFFVTA